MAEPRERTPEEREAARLEREWRRGQRDGGPPSEEPPVAQPERDDVEDLDEEEELPIGTRRVERWHRVHALRREHPQAARSPAERIPRSRAGRLISLLALVIAAALIWFLVELFQPLHGSGHGSITVTIAAHSSSSQVGDLLERDRVIGSSFFFELRATRAAQRSELRSGTYHLKLDMSYGDVLRILTTPPPPVKVTNLTIVEGRTRRQIDALLRAQGIPGSYLVATRHSPLLNPRAYGAPARTPSLEGFLFPSTYQLRAPVTVGALVADQLRAFRRQFATVKLGYPRSRHLRAYDVLIIASMVEAEAQTARDRPLIASVVYNRLAAGMPLQIDATTRYATGNYTRPLTVSELNSPSPYNTRTHKGLPPTPIDNPGMASIEAAAHPARINYLYFVVKPCAQGSHAFASSYQQFLAEVQQYQVARTKRGGRSPSRC
jgi:uncharacterized YceG family protein